MKKTLTLIIALSSLFITTSYAAQYIFFTEKLSAGQHKQEVAKVGPSKAWWEATCNIKEGAIVKGLVLINLNGEVKQINTDVNTNSFKVKLYSDYDLQFNFRASPDLTTKSHQPLNITCSFSEA